MTRRTSGFTVIELLIIVVVLSLAGIIFFVQKNNLQVIARDTQRKTAINAIYYSLEEVYYKQHSAYPKTITSNILPAVDPETLIDPDDSAIGEATSNYRYIPVNCTDNTCKSYTLRTTLENEADFVKQSRH